METLSLSHTHTRRAVTTLIPKKGNNGYLKNWRPVSLLCSDLKIFTRCIMNRLTKVLPEIIHVDQSYTIEKCSIHNNIHLLRDAINFSNIIYAFGFVEKFISFI